MSNIPEAVRKLLADPPPGSATRAAMDFGIDLTLTARNVYELTPTQRMEQLQAAMKAFNELSQALER